MRYFTFLAPGFFWALCALLWPNIAQAEMVSVAGDNVNMRSGPGSQHAILWQIGSGFPLEVLSRESNWLQVRDFEGSVGWVSSSTVNRNAHMIVKVNKGSNQSINVRIDSATSASIVAQASYGTVFKTLARKNGWVQVEHSLGPVGWVNESLLWGF